VIRPFAFISLGHPDGLAAVKDYPPERRSNAVIRIKGVDKQPEELRVPVERKAAER
jgi:hypothetical protein